MSLAVLMKIFFPFETCQTALPRIGLNRISTVVVTIVSVAALAADADHGQTETIRVDLELRTGGGLSGLVVDHSPHGVVIVQNTTPYVFAWDEIETPSAHGTMRDLKVLERGGAENLTAEDHFQLGLFALSRDCRELAAWEFGRATKLDPSYARQAREAFDRHREERKAKRAQPVYEGPLRKEPPCAAAAVGRAAGLSERVGVELTEPDGRRLAAGTSERTRARVLEIYKTFGETVRREISEDLALIETQHFLIWTDWTKLRRGALADWCEGMYAALCEQFRFDPSDNIFLAKCPVFCWRSKSRFLKFARRFDNHDGADAIGYTRSIEKSGHVHIVLLRQGRSEADFDRFACTLVHEGTHAFLHRLYSTRLIPHWVNEGYADLIAERVLGDRCPAGENAALLARQYVRYDWPIDGLLESVGPIGVHQYALAYSLVKHLESLGPERFSGFIRDIKEGRTVGEALAAHYEGITPAQLEARWRSAIAAEDETRPAADRPSVPWWSN